MEKRDILVLGATGFTGRLILKYLNSHPTRHSFSLGLAGRSAEKLQQLVAQFQPQDAPVHQLDLQNVDQVRSLVGTYRIVVTAVGPFWRYGKVVAQVCAELGTHYVDTTGEPHFIQYLIEQFDYLATKTGAILIPASGFDSVPSDLTAFYGVSALKRIYGDAIRAHTSTSAFAVHGQNISGGTAATMLDIFGGSVPPWMRKRLRDPWLLSPMIGSAPPPKLVYRLPFVDTPGFFFPMSPVNSAVVRRTWGLLQVNSTASQTPYGPKFEYEEFLETSNPVFAAIANLVIALFFVLLAFSSVFRSLLETFILHQPGSGPDESKFDQGWFRVTNITTSDEEHPRAVKAVVRGKGEPGYFLTSVMVGEIALALLPANRERLPAFAKQGGVLTPVSALGQELVERLKATQKFSFEEEQLDITATEPRKTR